MRMTSILISSFLALACTSSSDDGTATAASADSSATDPTGDSSAGDDVADDVADDDDDDDDGTSMSTDPDDSDSSAGSTDADDGVDTSGGSTTGSSEAPRVQFETTLGTIVFELDEVAAPITSANFLAYVDAGFFDGTDGEGATIVHRVIPGFVIQSGGLTEELDTKATMPPIVNESGNGLTNVRGSISMARTPDPDSATSQFFVNLVDNPGLDKPPGYAVFGAVVEGMDVVDAIADVETATMGPYDDVPVEPIIVTSVTRL
jgi:cyclophilin family peptidyl-prolyl cis-trans isomerase